MGGMQGPERFAVLFQHCDSGAVTFVSSSCAKKNNHSHQNYHRTTRGALGKHLGAARRAQHKTTAEIRFRRRVCDRAATDEAVQGDATGADADAGVRIEVTDRRRLQR